MPPSAQGVGFSPCTQARIYAGTCYHSARRGRVGIGVGWESYIIPRRTLDPIPLQNPILNKLNLKKVLDSNISVFYEPNLKLTCTTRVECCINTTDDIPIHQKVYPYPAAYAEEVRTELLGNGIIRPSHSTWTAPVWVVPKKSDASGEKKFAW